VPGTVGRPGLTRTANLPLGKTSLTKLCTRTMAIVDLNLPSLEA